MKRKWLQWILAGLVLVVLIGGPLAYSRHRQAELRNFRVVEDGKLYRSGQMSLSALKQKIDEFGIRTVISLRYAAKPGERPPDWNEEEFCTKLGIRYLRIRPREWSADEEGHIPSQEPVDEFLKVMDDPKVYPLLIHCFAGMHRTGSYCAIYRMEFQHWTNDEAMEELKALGYKNLEKEEDVQGYLESYVPRWKRNETIAH